MRCYHAPIDCYPLKCVRAASIATSRSNAAAGQSAKASLRHRIFGYVSGERFAERDGGVAPLSLQLMMGGFDAARKRAAQVLARAQARPVIFGLFEIADGGIELRIGDTGLVQLAQSFLQNVGCHNALVVPPQDS